MPILAEYAAEHPEFEISNMSFAEFQEDIFNLLDNLEHGTSRIESFVSNLKEFTRVSYHNRQNFRCEASIFFSKRNERRCC